MFWAQTIRGKFCDPQDVAHQWIELVRRSYPGTEARKAFAANSVDDGLGENAPRSVSI
jgi:hypothetical protein